MTLEEQIRSQWGQHGDWNSAGQDQVSALANLFRANNIDDLSQFSLKARDYTLPGQTYETEAGPVSELGRSGTAYDAYYGDKPLDFLGDINRDGSVSPYQRQSMDVADPNGTGNLRGDGNLLGWSAQGGGNTSFYVTQGPDGTPVVVPQWGSSSAETYGDVRGIASILGLAAGAYYAPETGLAGQMAQGGLKGAAINTAGNAILNPNGDVDSMTSGVLSGLGAGAMTAGIKGYGTQQGWNPTVTNAAANVAKTAVRGGDMRDAATSALTSGVGSWFGGQTGGQSPQSGDIGGGMSYDFASQFDPSLYDFGDTFDPNQSFDWNSINWSDAGSFTGDGFQTGGGGFDWSKLLNGRTLAALLGGTAGALDGKDKQQTTSRDPWAPAQPYLRGLLADGAQLYDQYKANPHSQAQQTAYGNYGGLLDAINSNAPGLLSGFAANASGANNYDRSNPRRQLTGGGAMDLSQWMPSLLGNFGTKKG